jgi:hypothetical protein
MKYLIRHAGAVGALLLAAFAPSAHAAGQARPVSDPADANASVPPTRYQSPLIAAPVSAGASSPADNWQALNRAVASYDSMTLTMDMPAPQAAAPPASATGTKPMQDPHAGHAMPPATSPDPHSRHRAKDAK